MILGIIASALRTVLAPFTAEAVEFDGVNDSMSREALFSGTPADSKFQTLSFWIWQASGTGSDRICHFRRVSDDARLNTFLQPDASGLEFGAFNSDGTATKLNVTFGNADLTREEWHHILLVIDMDSSANTKCYIDDVLSPSTFSTIPQGTLIDWSTFDSNDIGHQDLNASIMLEGDISELWTTNTYLDIDVEANRRKFISADGKPVNLGSDGSTPTGTQPIVYYSGNAAVWNAGTNKGSGGNFTMTGAVTDSTNEPVELP